MEGHVYYDETYRVYTLDNSVKELLNYQILNEPIEGPKLESKDDKSLKMHIDLNHSKQTIKCSKCPKEFQRKSQLWFHHKSEHTSLTKTVVDPKNPMGPKRYKCHLCNFAGLSRWFVIEVHHKRKHGTVCTNDERCYQPEGIELFVFC